MIGGPTVWPSPPPNIRQIWHGDELAIQAVALYRKQFWSTVIGNLFVAYTMWCVLLLVVVGAVGKAFEDVRYWFCVPIFVPAICLINDVTEIMAV